MKVLITGGAGFVGRHFCHALTKQGDTEVWVVDNLSTGLHPSEWMPHLNIEKNRKVHFFQEDIIDWTNKHNEAFDLVIHLAAIVEGRLTIENDPLKVAYDLAIDAYFFRWLLKNKPGALFYFSSSAVYPIKYQTKEYSIPLREDLQSIASQSIDFPDMTYGWSKLTGEYLTHIFHQRTGCSCAIFRPFSGYGEDQAKSYPFPAILERILMARKQSEKIIDVWGSGEQIRDFVYIDDCVRFALSLVGKQEFFTVNIGRGIPISFNQLIDEACRVLQEQQFIINPLLDKPQGVFCRYSDPSLQNQLLDFETINLSKGIELCIEYNKAQDQTRCSR
jgi:GDP-L-fucose synthase